jgi:SnoaL-like domain
MSAGRWALVASGSTLLALAGYGLDLDVSTDSASFTAARKAAVEQEVRQFSALVSRDVTHEGPAAWQKHLADDPAFFMAVDGKLQFANRQAAREGIEAFARTVPHIELTWGDDLRVDPLTPEFAVVASSWHEAWSDKEGHQTTENGFFTGLAERHNGQWQFRNAHWSVAAPASKAP